MKPAFSPNLMKAILISELTSSPCSETLHRFGFGSNDGSVGGVFGSVGSRAAAAATRPSRPRWRPCRSRPARCRRTPAVLARALTDGAADQDRHQGERRRVLEVAAPRSARRERRTSRANMACADPFRCAESEVDARPAEGPAVMGPQAQRWTQIAHTAAPTPTAGGRSFARIPGKLALHPRNLMGEATVSRVYPGNCGSGRGSAEGQVRTGRIRIESRTCRSRSGSCCGVRIDIATDCG